MDLGASPKPFPDTTEVRRRAGFDDIAFRPQARLMRSVEFSPRSNILLPDSVLMGLEQAIAPEVAKLQTENHLEVAVVLTKGTSKVSGFGKLGNVRREAQR